MKCEHVCQTCGLEGESINHVLFTCTLEGFDQTSIYANMSYLFQIWRNHEEMRWNTKRNSLLFEGILYDGERTCTKAVAEANVWLSAQEEMIRDGEVVFVPPRQFVKCNIGMKWSNVKKELGAAWILRNSEATVLLHNEAYYLSLTWAIESMVSLRCQRDYFAIEGGMLVSAINIPKAWPSFKNKVSELRHLLGELLEWSVMKEIGDVNRDTHLIANSVVNGDRFQSYVARGYPSWL
ncbi:hypothetical protein Bca52824_085938 [Brassica carinata]|uniref:Reverse transcriptase zinc-binding domain-containing protein n=1 Tax=Brassica carinata TaxID=52824 RepID=A0A8X7P7M4_BRACI|nr:hypothetical protein Bca52824_085938 [Brassica carinata]